MSKVNIDPKRVKVSRASKKEANRKRYRQINAQLALATKAEKAGKDPMAHYVSAMELTKSPLFWESEAFRVASKCFASTGVVLGVESV